MTLAKTFAALVERTKDRGDPENDFEIAQFVRVHAREIAEALAPETTPDVKSDTAPVSDALRPAVDVYLAAEGAYWATDTSETDADGLKAAAAVIEADRAGLCAEITRLTLTVRKLQGHQAALESCLREIRDLPVARSGDAWKRHCMKLQAIATDAVGDGIAAMGAKP